MTGDASLISLFTLATYQRTSWRVHKSHSDANFDTFLTAERLRGGGAWKAHVRCREAEEPHETNASALMRKEAMTH